MSRRSQAGPSTGPAKIITEKEHSAKLNIIIACDCEYNLREYSKRALSGAAQESLTDHVDLVNGLGVVPHTLRCSVLRAVGQLHTGAFGVEHLLVRSGEHQTRCGPWQRNGAQIPALGAENLNTGGLCRDIQAALRVDTHAVSTSVALQRGKCPLICSGAIGPDIIAHYRLAIRQIERLLVGAQYHSV